MANWIPANALLQRPYSKMNYSDPLNIAPNSGTRNQNFLNAVKANTNNGKRMGNQSVYGTVTKIGGKFVKKTMAFTTTGSDSLKIFLNEVRVGSIPGIQAVGPKIYAWRINRDAQGKAVSGSYIMDDFTISPPNYKTVLVYDYFKNVLKGACPAPQSNFYQKLKESLTKFWQITKGYHGDLHIGNMAVTYHELSLGVKKFLFFDYGSHKKFKTATNSSKSFENFISIIEDEVNKRASKKTTEVFHNNGIATIEGLRGQPRRSNIQLLREVGLGSKYNQSLMSCMNPANYTRRVTLAPRAYGIAKTHKHLFVTKRNFNNELKRTGINPRPGNSLLQLYKQLYPTWTNERLTRYFKKQYPNYSENNFESNQNKKKMPQMWLSYKEFTNMVDNFKKL